MIKISDNFYTEDTMPQFAPGDLVVHKRYKYRGVIVSMDDCCKADDDWYSKNQSQPDRGQPWYHVLVDRTEMNTYPAEENLMPDESGLPIAHSHIDYFFNSFENGHYVRNDRTWPG
jgi:heat shock protein HspQ